MKVWEVMKGAALAGAAVAATMAAPNAFAQQYSVWLVENSRFMGVPYGAFMPDRAFVPGSTSKFNNINTVDLPVNVGVIKGMVNGKLEVVLADCGWKQQDYHKMTGTQHWAPLPDQLKLLGITADQVTKIVIGHGHWDHAGSLSDFPNAVLYVQRKELEGIEWALNYPEPHIRADNIAGCFRTPACGYPPKTLDEIYGKVLGQKAMIVDGEFDVLPGIKIHPAWHCPHRRLAAAGSAHRRLGRHAGVRQRHLLFVAGYSRLDGGQHPKLHRQRAAVPGLREVLQADQ